MNRQAQQQGSIISPAHGVGLALWHRGDAVTLNGSVVSSWTDLSGNGRHSTQGTTAQQIPWEASCIGGRPGLHSAGAGYLNTANLSSLTAGHLLCVVQGDHDPSQNSGNDGHIWGLGGGGSPSFYPFTDGVIYEGAMSTSRRTTTGSNHSLASPHIFEIVSTSSEYTLSLDGTQIYTTATNTFGIPSSGFLFNAFANTGSCSKLRMTEIILWGAKQDSTFAALQRRILGSRYGISTV